MTIVNYTPSKKRKRNVMGKPPLTLVEIHAILQAAYNEIGDMHGRVDKVSTDTAFAIGECLGLIGKAKALVGRDMDQEKK